MKSVLAVFCVFVAHSNGVSLWLGLEKANRTNVHKYEKHCLEIIYNLGPMEQNEVRKVPGTCIQATCTEERNIKFDGCPSVALSDRVHCAVYQGDSSKEYPDCCFEIKCNENVTTETSETLPQIYEGFINMSAVDISRKQKKKETES